jgi:hypothetical protein
VEIAATVYVADFGSETKAPETATFAAKIIRHNLKITYYNGDDNLADNSSSGVVILIDSSSYVNLETDSTDIDSDGAWDPGDFIQLPKSGLASDPYSITVVVSGTTVLDAVFNI